MSWHFQSPEWGYATLVLPLLAWLAWRDARLGRRVGRAGWPRSKAPAPWRAGLAMAALGLGILAAVGLACAPVADEPAPEQPVAGADLVLALDLSRSMAARDLRPDRATRARSEIAALLDALEGERVALVGFAGDARLLVPLTTDADAVLMRAVRASPADTRVGGTDLGVALQRSLKALGPEPSGGQILLLTDGEDRGERGRAAAARAAELGVRVHAVGVATAFGARIPVAGERGETWLLEGPGGEAVLSTLEEAALRAIAAAGEGEALMLGEVEGEVADWWRTEPGTLGKEAQPHGEDLSGERSFADSFAANLRRALLLLAVGATAVAAALAGWRGRGPGR